MLPLSDSILWHLSYAAYGILVEVITDDLSDAVQLELVLKSLRSESVIDITSLR